MVRAVSGMMISHSATSPEPIAGPPPGEQPRMPPATVAGAFMHTVKKAGRNCALITSEGVRISYDELRTEVERAVQVLERLGCAAGDRVAILLPNVPAWPILQYACALLGCVIVPVNLRYRSGEMGYVLSHAHVRVLFLQRHFLSNDLLGRLAEIGQGRLGENREAAIPALPDLKHIVLMDTGERVAGTVAYVDLLAPTLAKVDLEELARMRRPRDPLWVFWTSGTTSRAKGAIISHDAVGNVWNWTSMVGYMATDRVMANFPLFYIAGNFWSMLGALLHGATLVLAQVLSASEIAMLCRREGVTILSGVPMMLKDLADDPTLDPADFATVRLGFFGGGVLTEQEIARVQKRLGYQRLMHVYGMTELQGFSASTAPDDPPEVAARSCGRPLPGFEFRLVNPSTGEIVPLGETGELLVRGRQLLGYEGVSEEDRARLLDAEGWFHTGDLMRQGEDGRYSFVGRTKDLIKVGGENVSAAEIEAALADHPQVATAAVIARDDPRRGEIPIAFVSALPGETIDSEALLKWCRERMAPFKVPRRIEVISGDRWPRTASGKIAKWQLATPTEDAD